MFGGNINSQTPANFLKKKNKPLPLNYEQMNFNDFPNTIVFMWNIFINNNWLDMAYMALLKFSKRKANFAKWYFVLFLVLTQFLVLNIIIGKYISLGIFCVNYY